MDKNADDAWKAEALKKHASERGVVVFFSKDKSLLLKAVLALDDRRVHPAVFTPDDWPQHSAAYEDERTPPGVFHRIGVPASEAALARELIRKALL